MSDKHSDRIEFQNMLSERSQSQKGCDRILLMEIVYRSVQTRQILRGRKEISICWGLMVGGRGVGGQAQEGNSLSVWGLCFWRWNVLQLIVVMAAQLCEQSKKHWTVQFKWVNYTVWELYLNKAVILFLKSHKSIPESTVCPGRSQFPKQKQQIISF